RHDPRSRAAFIPSRVEVLSIHGDADGIVDIGFSRVFPAARTELPGADHADVIDPDSPYSARIDRKSTRLNSSHVSISYAVFCLSPLRPPLPALPTRRSSDLAS